ncbi:NrfD/PsrC family molybdoenzyme membrane anchor subunit, partial [Candidatus Sumerlaeota bacterium]
MLNRVTILKSVLWLLVGVWATVTVARFLNGLGSATALSDVTPWGLWIGFDVMAGVALAAGGFVIAATVYIFGLEQYRAFVRPAILTAFLGYGAVAVGLLYDLGLPWNIWHPMIYWQYHSVLFEVATCVMLYLTVLALEFAPAVLEHPLLRHRLFQTAHQLLKKVTILLVIAGIVLSTLHQSSLGSLFLIAPARLHPLWYSKFLYVFFFVSAVGLGLMTITLESLLSGYFFRHRIRTELLSGLGVAAAVVLGLYAVGRLADQALQGNLAPLLDGSWQSSLFIFELAVSAIVPALLLALPRVRHSVAGLAVCSAMTVLGMIMYRLDVCIIAFARPGNMPYFPAWTEIAISLGVVSAAALAFIFFIENLRVYDEPEPAGDERQAPAASYDPATSHYLSPYTLLAPRRYSLAFVAGAALAAFLLPRAAIFGSQPLRTPVRAPRTLEGQMIPRGDGLGHELAIVKPGQELPAGARQAAFLKIDGNANGRLVLFPHDDHIKRLGGKPDSCAKCHHLNMPFDNNTSCFECHRDMFGETDIFDHAS